MFKKKRNKRTLIVLIIVLSFVSHSKNLSVFPVTTEKTIVRTITETVDASGKIITGPYDAIYRKLSHGNKVKIKHSKKTKTSKWQPFLT